MMPVDIPDSTIHKICLKCHRWFEPEEGVLMEPESFSPLGRLRSVAKSIAGDEPDLRFICSRCLRRKQWTKAIIWISFAVVVGVAFLAAWLRGEL
jgi:hypothetical protein